MEYDPADVVALIAPIERGVADVVYGSRLTGGAPQRAYLFWHLVGNRFLSLLTGVLFNTTLSDMETGYKAFRSDVLRSLRLTQDSFAIEPEITGEVCRRGPAHLRDADRLLRAHVRRGQEHHVARRLQGDRGARAGPSATAVSSRRGVRPLLLVAGLAVTIALHVPRRARREARRRARRARARATCSGSCRRASSSGSRSGCASCAGGCSSTSPRGRRCGPSATRPSSATSSTTSCRRAQARRRASSRCYGKARTPRAEAIGTVVIERVFDLLALLFLLFASYPLLPEISWLKRGRAVRARRRHGARRADRRARPLRRSRRALAAVAAATTARRRAASASSRPSSTRRAASSRCASRAWRCAAWR